jgi:hypothetical protein
LSVDADQRRALIEIARSRTEPANRVELAGIILAYLDEPSAYAVARAMRVSQQTLRKVIDGGFFPNGIAVYPDNTEIWIGDCAAGRMWYGAFVTGPTMGCPQRRRNQNPAAMPGREFSRIEARGDCEGHYITRPPYFI